MKKVACILKGYPRLSETFIAQEILALEEAGVDLIIYSLRLPTDKDVHEVHRKINARINYLPEYLYQQPIRVLKGFISSLFSGNMVALLGVFGRDLIRDFSFNRIRRLGQGMVLFREIEPDREWLYAHFLHTPASVTRYCSILSGLPWSCSAHAKDIWTSPSWEIREKLADLDWLVTCTSANFIYLRGLAEDNDKGKINLLYHGLDLARFGRPDVEDQSGGLGDNETFRILSVGRAVNKKGYDVLLLALSELPNEMDWQFVHIGGGVLSDRLLRQAADLGISHRISWLGAQPSDIVLEQYRQADVFVLPSRIDADGDRDGLPNVIMEAMSQELPCIASDISGIPEIIENEINGILVSPDNQEQLRDQITRLANDPELRANLGKQARIDVLKIFSLNSNIGSLISRFK